MERATEPGILRALLGTVALAAIFFLSLLGLQPPGAKPRTIPAAQFSALRAIDALHRVLNGDVPHPVGSPANDAVRTRLIAELTQLGYAPQVQTAFDCNDFGVCASVNNVLARLDGSSPGEAVLLSAHYDSVPASPGDSDDGAGVAAVLEIARALKSLSQRRHAVILLLDDGEEEGLLGARAFVDSHPWAEEVRAAVNLDARGTHGPSLLFETGSASNWAVRLYARTARRPATSSLYSIAYKSLPNGTDFSVFKAAGIQGLNFAYVGGEPQYHTPLDNSANLNLATLQQQGENALASVLALANADLSRIPAGNAVYFDLFGRAVVHWPARRTLAWALLAALLLLGQIAYMVWARRLLPQEYLWGLLSWLIIVAIVAALALLLRVILALAGVTPVNWIAHPLPAEVAFASLAAATVVVSGILLVRRTGFWGMWSGVWSWWAVLAILIGAQSHGLGYVLLIPMGAAALAGLPATLTRGESMLAAGAAAIVPLAAAGLVGFPSLLLLYDGFGNHSLILIALAAGLLLTPFAPLCADLRRTTSLRSLLFPAVPAVMTLLASFAAVVAPAYSAKSPQRMNIAYWEDSDSGMAQWIVLPDSGRLPLGVRVAAAFRSSGREAFPWSSRPGYVADAPQLSLAAPTFTILESSVNGDLHSYRALLRSERDAPYAAVLFPRDADIESVRISGHPLAREISPDGEDSNRGPTYACPAMPPEGIEISFSLPVGRSVKITVEDRSYGLPPEGAFLLNSRSLAATPSGDGDLTILSRRVQLLP